MSKQHEASDFPITRRNLLQGAAVLAPSLSVAAAKPAVASTMYVGCYTLRGKGISSYRVNPGNGALEFVKTFPGGDSPSFITIDPKGRFLYAANEVNNYQGRTTGYVTAMAIDPSTGDLTMLNQQPAEGTGTCYVSVEPSGRFLLTANYAGGTISMLPIQSDGKLGAPSHSVKHSGDRGPSPRQTVAHAHIILPDAKGRFALVNDLGLDRTFIYKLDLDNGKFVPNDPPFAAAEPGSGPRHLAFHPSGRFVYVINELASTVAVFTWDGERGVLNRIQTISTLPKGYQGSNTTAQVVVAPSGRFVYGSNRGHNSLAIFSVDQKSGKLTFVGNQWTQGQTPRNFNIEPSGNYLYAGHQDSDNIVTFRVNQKTGRLTPTGQFMRTGQPVCLIFRSA